MAYVIVDVSDDNAPRAESWGRSSWDTKEDAFDAFLRVLDSFGCVPGWDALSFAHDRFVYSDMLPVINGTAIREV